MKKIVSILLSLGLVLSLAFAVYASGRNDHKDKYPAATASVTPSTSPAPTVTPATTLDGLLVQLKDMNISKELREKIIKLIIDYRKKKGDKTMPVFFNNVLVKLESPAVVKGRTVSVPAKTMLTVTGANVIEGNDQIIAIYPAVSVPTTTGSAVTVTTTGAVKCIVIDKKTGKIYKNGTETKVKASSQKSKKTYLPSEFFSKVLDMKVEYNTTAGALMISTK